MQLAMLQVFGLGHLLPSAELVVAIVLLLLVVLMGSVQFITARLEKLKDAASPDTPGSCDSTESPTLPQTELPQTETEAPVLPAATAPAACIDVASSSPMSTASSIEPSPTVMEPSIPEKDLEKGGRLLGEGGHAQVYAGKWVGTHVAIKVPKNDSPTLEIEAATLTQLRHPCICVFIGTAMLDGTLAIVMEHLDGGSLDKFLQLDMPPSERREISFGHRMAIAQEAAIGLAFLHTQGYVHRDVKPANILLTASGHAKVTDFGIAKHGALSSSRGEWTNTPCVGTMRYMAPEVMIRQSDSAPPPLEGKITEAMMVADELVRRPVASSAVAGGAGPSDDSMPGDDSTIAMDLPRSTHRKGAARYGMPSDVYSFGLMLYEIMYRERAFHEFSQLQFVYTFTFRGQRPTLPPPSFQVARESLASGVRPDETEALVVEILISSCWQSAPNSRPSMSKVVETLLTIDSSHSPPAMPVADAASAGGKQPYKRWGRLSKSMRGLVRRPGKPPSMQPPSMQPPSMQRVVAPQDPSNNSDSNNGSGPSVAMVAAERDLYSAKVQQGTAMAMAIEDAARTADDART